MPGQKDDHSFAEVVDAHYEGILRGALAVTGDKHLAEEIVQETFVCAFKKFSGFRGRSSAFNWLYAIMLNKYRDHCRRRKLLRRLGFWRVNGNPGPKETVGSRSPSPYAELAESDESKLLMEAVSKLPVKHREVIAMRYFDGLSLNEAAEILDCRLGTIKSRLANARKRLHKALREKLRDGYEGQVPRS